MKGAQRSSALVAAASTAAHAALYGRLGKAWLLPSAVRGGASNRTYATSRALLSGATALEAAEGGRLRRQLRLAVVRPDLVDDWIPELNDVDVQAVSCQEATTPVWWRCPRCQGQYQCTVQSRVARGRAACPQCGGCGCTSTKVPTSTPIATVSSATSSEALPHNLTASSVKEEDDGETLDKTHPEHTARWDYALNGTLLPSHVTATSTRMVWWRPAGNASATTSSFLRPVFAFVYDTAGPQEKAAARAAMEWELLDEICEVTHAEEAERAGVIPVSFRRARGHRSDSERCPDKQLDADAASSSTALSAEDARVVAQLWRKRASKLLCTAAVWEKAGDEPHNSRPFPRELFAHSINATTVNSDSIVREAILNGYYEFVCRQRAVHGLASPTALIPVLPGLSAEEPRASSDTAHTPTWTSFFQLTQDQARPKGHINASASLYFAGATEWSARAASASKAATEFAQRSSHSKASVDGMAPYPRLPPSPRLREDDVMESTPPMGEDGEDGGKGSTKSHTLGGVGVSSSRKATERPTYAPRFHIDQPFGRSVGAQELEAAQLAAEYDGEDEAPYVGRDLPQAPGLHRDLDLAASDRGVSLAEELRVATSGEGSDGSRRIAGNSGGHKSGNALSLVESAIAALGDAFQPTDEDLADRRYRRELHYAATPTSGEARRTSARPRRFRLIMPQEAPRQQRNGRTMVQRLDESVRVHATSSSSLPLPPVSASATTDGRQTSFDAPNTPRKVARPRRMKQGAAASSENAEG